MMQSVLLLVSLGGILAQNFNFLVCPEDWLPHGDKCYQFVYSTLKYDDAAHACQKNGAILLSVDSIPEHNFVTARLRTTDILRNDWYTSGERDSSAVFARYVWTATNQEVSLLSSIWINKDEPYNSDITRDLLVYMFDPIKGIYGIAAVTDRSLPRPYICEISRNEVYRININRRGFDYGVPYKNLNDVHRGPKFIMEATSTVVISDEAKGLVYMECIASGIPQPDYGWIRNDSGVIELISSQMDTRYTITNGKLSIEDPVETNDAGIYQCKVQNSEGAIVSAPAQLSFAGLGDFPNINPAPVSPLEYQGAVIACPDIPSRFSEAVVYQWKKSEEDRYTGDISKVSKSDVRPDLNKHIFVSGNGKLYFSEVTSADNYYYYCIATLTTLNLNQNFISTALSPSRTSRAVLLYVRSSAGGTYEPRIQDSFINVVPGSPVVGMNISLECFAYGTMPLMYTWDVPPGVRGRYELSDSNRVLRISNVQQDDSGRYSCRVESGRNIGQQSDVKDYILYVESKPDFIVPLTDQHLDIGTMQLTWRCEARAVPFPVYTWYKNGEIIENSTAGDRLVVSNTLFLRNLEHKKDGGMYQCVASNSHGVSSTAAQLRILAVKPSFSKFPLSSTMAGAEGGNITIECRPEAAPFPEITWFRNGASLNPGTDAVSHLYMTVEGDLKIRDLSVSDQGEYECRAVNELGEDRNKTFLSILQRTMIYQPPQPQQVAVNKTGFMFCRASFNQNDRDLIYVWAFNGRIIQDIDKSVHYRRGTPPDQEGGLYVIFSQYRHSGRYTCIAQTQVDSASATTTLFVTGPPGETAGVEAFSSMDQTVQGVGVGATDVVLRWTDPVETHGSPVSSYMIYGQTNYTTDWTILYTYVQYMDTMMLGELDGQRRQYLVQNLKPGVAYVFKLRAVNAYGVGHDSKPTRRIVVPGSRPLTYPRNIGGGGGSVGTLRITWDALEAEDHHGWGIGYYVEYRMRPPMGEEVTSNIKWTNITVKGNQGEMSALVGKENFFLLYQVKVTPYNVFGQGPTGQNDSVYSAEQMPIGIPTNVYAEPFNESALIVHWDPVENTRIFMKGQLKGYKIDYWLMPPNITRTGNAQTSRSNQQNREQALQAVIYGEVDRGMIIGLLPDTFYTVSVTVFNGAGNGLTSEVAHQSTDRSENSTRTSQTLQNYENRVGLLQAIVYGDVDQGMIIGLRNNTWYTITVTVFNRAGNGLKSEVGYQKTDKSAPRNYPVHVYVYPHGQDSVLVKFRGLSTTVFEEPLLGYMIRYWRDTEDIRNAENVDCERNTEGIIYTVQSGYLYHLRVLGYSVGGDGKMSSPETQFSYFRGRIAQVIFDPSTTEIVVVYQDGSDAARVVPSYVAAMLLPLLTTLVFL